MSGELLTDFAWIDEDGALHLDVPKMLRHMGVPDTAENRDACCEMAAEHLKKLLKDHPSVIKITE